MTTTMTEAEQNVRNMLQTQSYNASMIPTLEEYLVLMCRSSVPYMFHAVRTLIKLYTLFPYSNNNNPQNNNTATTTDSSVSSSSSSSAKSKILDNMGLCCLLALTYGSNKQDIVALRYMIPMTYIPKDNVHILSQVLHCTTLYENSLFNEFWTSYSTSFLPESTIKSGLPITEMDIMIRNVATTAIPILQTSILMILSITYQKAPVDIVYPSLHITTLEEWKVIVQRNLTIVMDNNDNNIIHFIPTPHNTQRVRTFQENIDYTTTIATLRQ